MKKIGAFFATLVFGAGVTFAQVPDGVSLGFWGQMAFVPFELQVNQEQSPYQGLRDRIRAGIGPSWGLQPNGRAANIMFRGGSANIGFGVEIEADIDIRLGEYAYIWARTPGDFARLDVGVFMNHIFRGTRNVVNFSHFALPMASQSSDLNLEDAIFNRFAVRANEREAGALLLLNPLPMRDVTFAAFMRIAESSLEAGPQSPIGPTTLMAAFERIQVAAGYRIPGVGFLRMQFLNAPRFSPVGVTTPPRGVYGGRFERGDFDDYYNLFRRMELAFQMTVVQGLSFDMGFKFPFPASANDIDYGAPFVISLGAGYGFGDLVVNLGFIGWFGGGVRGMGTDYDFGSMISANLNPVYDFGAFSVGATIGIDYKAADTLNGGRVAHNDRLDLGFGAYIRRNFGRGNIQAGLTYTMLNPIDDRPGTRAIGYFRVPILMEIYF